MKLTQCMKGHFYDSEKYMACPYCSESVNTEEKGGESRMTNSAVNQEYAGNLGINVTRSGVSLRGSRNEDNPTVGFADSNSSIPAGYQTPEGKLPSAGEGDETYPYMVWHPQEKQGDAVRKNGMGRSAGPVVGWLVCIEGNHYGASFNLYGGKNFVGRSENMDIPLTGDITVSREKHAIIIYEPRQRKFFAQPGESRELFYVNNSVVLQSTQLQDRDVVTIGKTSLVFVPFCDERYGWGDNNIG